MEGFKGTKGEWKVGIPGTVVSEDYSQINKEDEKRGESFKTRNPIKPLKSWGVKNF